MRSLLPTLLAASLTLGACGTTDPKPAPTPQTSGAPAEAKAVAPMNPHADPHAAAGVSASAGETANPHGGSPGMGFMPEYEEGGGGMRIAEIRPGGAAEKCGLQAGDVVTKFAGLPVGDVHDYMAALATVKSGDKVQIEIKRGGEAKTIDAVVGVSNR